MVWLFISSHEYNFNILLIEKTSNPAISPFQLTVSALRFIYGNCFSLAHFWQFGSGMSSVTLYVCKSPYKIYF